MSTIPVEVEHRMRELKVLPVEASGEDHSPKYKYTAQQFGQVNYLKVTCKNSGMAVDSYGKDVQIFSRRKLPQFVGAIDQSLELLNKPDPVLPCSTMTYRIGQRVLCVMVERDGVLTMYVVESNLEDTMFHVYEKNIPKAQVLKIYSKKREMVEALINEEKLFI